MSMLRNLFDSLLSHLLHCQTSYVNCSVRTLTQHQEKQTLYAVGYHCIFDNKVEQKLLCFFVYGSPNFDYLFNTWVCIAKGRLLAPMKQLFNHSVGRNDNNTVIVEQVLAAHVYALTCAKRTAEWFLFRWFHLMATTASRILNFSAEV